MAAAKKPKAGDIICATTVTGKGISLGGGFIQAVIKPGANGVVSLAREDGMLVIQRVVNGNKQHVEIPLVAVALELATDG